MRKLAILGIFSLSYIAIYADENSIKDNPSRSFSKSGRRTKDSDSWEWESDLDDRRSNSLRRGWESDDWASSEDSSDRSYRERPRVSGNRISRGGDSDWSSDDWDSDYSENRVTGNVKQIINNGDNSRRFYDSSESDSDSVDTRIGEVTRSRLANRRNMIGSSDEYYDSMDRNSDSSDSVEARRELSLSRTRKTGFSNERDSDNSGSIRRAFVSTDSDEGNNPIRKTNQRFYESDESSDWFSDESDNSDRSGRGIGNRKARINIPRNTRKDYSDSDSSDWLSSERGSVERNGNKNVNSRENAGRYSDSDDWFSDENSLFESDSYEKMSRAEIRTRGWRDDDDDDDDYSDRRNSRIIKRLGRPKRPSKSRSIINRIDDSDDGDDLPAGVAFLGKDDN